MGFDYLFVLLVLLLGSDFSVVCNCIFDEIVVGDIVVILCMFIVEDI